jgi:Ca2+-binding RTX toxin-like protein
MPNVSIATHRPTPGRNPRRVGRGLVALVGVAGLLATFPAVAAPVGSGAKAPTCLGVPATIVDLRESAEVWGTPGPDVIVVRAEASVYGRGGNDLICGHGDLRGGPGDDEISMRGNPDGELDFVSAFGRTGDDTIRRDEPPTDDPHFWIESFGGPGNDELFGGPNPDLLAGGPGDDRVLGRGSVNFLLGGAGSDHLLGGPSRDHVIGGPGPDDLHGGAHRDRLNGAAGNDLILAGDGMDQAFGSSGDDRIFGQKGVDSADGGPGEDVCRSETVLNCEPE